MQYDIKEMVKGDKKVRFTHFRRNELWYVTDCGFAFAVPASDVGDATFNMEERAMLLMRYIRKQLAANKAGMEESLAGTVPNCC
jgi:hypothetical protein